MARRLHVFARNPAFAATVVAVIALGIGPNAALFGLAEAVLVRTLPFPEPDRLVRLDRVLRVPSASPMATAWPAATYLEWPADHRLFTSVAAYQGRAVTLTEGDRPAALTAVAASAELFAVLGTPALLGRTFVPEDDRPGAQPVAILSHRHWQAGFGGDPSVLGRDIRLDGTPHRVIGVMPDLHCGVWGAAAADVWLPLAWSESERASREAPQANVIARLKAGVDLREAAADVAARRLGAPNAGVERDWTIRLVPVREYLLSAVRPTLFLLMGAVTLVFLVACANVATLLLARAVTRRKEMAIRAALGESRVRAVFALVGEAVLLSAAGGALGLVVAHWGIEAVRPYLAPRADGAALDGGVLAFTLGLALVTGVVTGLAPALRATGRDLDQTLRRSPGRTDADSGSPAARQALIAAEVALSLVLLLGAGLLIRSVHRLWSVDPGFDPRGVLTADVRLSEARYPDPSHQVRFFNEVLARVQALPGVESAAAVDCLPLSGPAPRAALDVGGRTSQVALVTVSSGYRRTLRIALRRGRDLAEADGPLSTPVVLVSESVARDSWPEQDPLGRQVTLSGLSREVVGVVADVRQDALDAEPVPAVYTPLAQAPATWLSLVVRATVEPTSLSNAVTSAVLGVDPDQPVAAIASLEAVIAESDSLYERRFSVLLLGGFAMLGLVLASVGIYGALSFLVGCRVGEIGVRMALGAEARDVLWLIVREGMRPTSIGLVIGILASLVLRPLLAVLLYGVTAADPVTFAAVPLLIAAVALAASVLPALRATRIEAMEALRN